MNNLNPNSIEELKNIVCSNNRMKFMVKVLYVLQFIEKYPIFLEQVGASWWFDGIHFIVNSKTLGEFLNLQPNSINTNFRDHGFQILSCSFSEIQEKFPNLSNPKQWKKRITNYNPFSNKISLIDVEKIPLINSEQPLITQSPIIFSNNDVIPNETYPLLYSQNIISIKKTLCSLPLSFETQKNLLIITTNYWKKKIGNIQFCNIKEAYNKFFDFITDNLKSLIIRTNFFYLINNENNLSQYDNLDKNNINITFEQYFNLFLRYGSPKGDLTLIEEVSLIPSYLDLNIFNEIPFTLEYSSFIFGFNPLQSKTDTIHLIHANNIVTRTWSIIHSKKPNRFSLFTYCHLSSPNSIFLLYINYDSINIDQNKRFSIDYGNEIYYSSNLNDLLFNILKFYPNSGIHSYYSNPEIIITTGLEISKLSNDEKFYPESQNNFSMSQFDLN